jgi:hypothetical protein
VRLSAYLFFISFALPHTLPLFADEKTFLVTLPVVTIGREGSLHAEFSLKEKGTLGLDWAEWGGLFGTREELTSRERAENPGQSLVTEGRDMSLEFARYTDPYNMSGFYWGLGVGYRMMRLDWSETLISEDGSTRSRYYAYASGPAVNGRLGYRFVGDSVGVVLGSFVGLKYFLSDITDKSSEDTRTYSFIDTKTRSRLQNKIATLLKIGIDIGWAF